jgi:hypothetical protein
MGGRSHKSNSEAKKRHSFRESNPPWIRSSSVGGRATYASRGFPWTVRPAGMGRLNAAFLLHGPGGTTRGEEDRHR